ncbi:hypothetical protein B0H10DRAFT_2161202 [Mycena sp. CBHHK59/15]|nr:hypothetical protein B0H10DRAFT_2161202 [Mycena sp. CBHHK59/15]
MHDFPIKPTSKTLSFFVVYMCHYIKPNSVNSYLSGICNQLEDHFPNICKSRNSQIVSKTLTSCKHLHSSATQCKQPLTQHYLSVFIDWLTTRTQEGSVVHNDYLFLLQLLSSFYTLLHLGELTYPDKVSLCNPCKVAQCNSATWCQSGYGYFLPAHKADAFFEGNTFYLESRNKLFPYHPQLWLCSNGQVPTHSWFIKRLCSFFPGTSIAGKSSQCRLVTKNFNNQTNEQRLNYLA